MGEFQGDPEAFATPPAPHIIIASYGLFERHEPLPGFSTSFFEGRWLGMHLRRYIHAMVICLIVVFNASTALGQPEVIKVGIYQNYPLSFVDSTGQAKGMFVDIIDHIARIEDWQIDYRYGSWSDCLRRLKHGEIDLLGVIAYSNERNRHFDYTFEAVLTDWGQLYSRSGTAIESIVDLDGKKIAVLQNDIYYDALKDLTRQFGIRNRFIEAFEYEDVLLMVELGVCDAGLVNQIYGYRNESSYSIKKTGIAFSPQKLYYAAPKDRHLALLNTIDTHLRKLKGEKRSIYYQSMDKWLGPRSIAGMAGWLKWAMAGFFILLLLSVVISIVFRAQVKVKTRELSTKNEALVSEIENRKKADRARQEQNLYMTALHDVTLGLISRLDLEDLLKNVIDRAGELINTKDAFIYLYEASANQLTIRVGTGFYRNLVGYRINPGDGLAGSVWQTGDTIAVEDYSRWDGRLEDPIFDNLKSAIVVPLAIEQRVLGVIGMSYFGRTKHFGEAEVTILKRLAELASIAIDNAQLYADLQQELRERKEAEEENKRLHKQLLHSQKMEAIGTMAGGIAHDFNNILQTISGYTQLLILEKERDNPDVRRLIEIDLATHKAGELTRQLLTFSRKVETRFIPTNLNFHIKNTFKILERTLPKMVTLQLNLEEGIKEIKADINQIEQVLLNISINAHHAMPEGGTLTFATRNVVLDDQFCENHLGSKPGEYVLLQISDDGIGMSEEVLSRIFEPFFTTKTEGKGTGLGLAIVYGIVKAHGGYIICESLPGRGTEFKMYFPVITHPVTPPPLPKPETEPIPTGRETILVVDDDKSVLNLAQNMLALHGYRVLLAENGEAALDIVRNRADGIDLIILDLNMPGMGGQQCFDELTAMVPEIRIVVTSGFTPTSEFKSKISGPHYLFVEKPFDVKLILKRIRQLLDR